ncbi:hypothetical protein ACFYZ8_33385 [Streptomyces sp. NPDC001668]|uniref:hypothetical protein n=1 Tax=Streptomyces sp. NPDC001668 TaxID=3364598 RepID=UPI00369AA5BD
MRGHQRERCERDERLARGEDSHLCETRALAYIRNRRGHIFAVAGPRLAPALFCEELQAEALVRNGQMLIPLTAGEPPPKASAAEIPEGATSVAVMPQPKTPSVAIARVLRRLGLAQGRGKDFRVTGFYRGSERLHTFVVLYTRAAQETVAAHADAIEQAPELGGFAFTVSVRYSGGHPVTSIRNGACERVREQPPAPADAKETADAAESDEAVETAPVVDWRERWRREEQAKELGWSAQHAEAVRRAAAGELVRDADGTPRRITRAGRAGARVAAGRISALEGAGFLATVKAADGSRRIEATADGLRALLVWDAEQPEPVTRSRRQECMPLRPLLYGQEWRQRRDEFLAEEERRRIEREKWWAEWEIRRAEEEREERRWKAWAAVEGVRYTWRKRPRGWVPTDEQVRLHGLDLEVVAELRAEAAQLAAEEAEAAREAAGADAESEEAGDAGPASVQEDDGDGELWDGVPDIIAGPGVVVPGMHVQFLPEHRPGPRTRHAFAGEIVSVGTTHVRWRPYTWHQDVRTPLEHMRINAVMHVNQTEDVRRNAAALNAGRALPGWPEWCRWSLARHLQHAAQQRTGPIAHGDSSGSPPSGAR